MHSDAKMELIGGRQKLLVALGLTVAFLLALWFVPALIPIGICLAAFYDIGRATRQRRGYGMLVWLGTVVLLGCLGMALVLSLEGGTWLFFSLALVASLTDASAQLIGRQSGIPGTFMPAYSPSKSLAGVLGSWLVGLLIVAPITLGVLWLMEIPVPPMYVVALWLTPLVSTYGDILASATKRAAGLKDFGTYLGKSTGGALDRVDSWVAVFAVAFVALLLPAMAPLA